MRRGTGFRRFLGPVTNAASMEKSMNEANVPAAEQPSHDRSRRSKPVRRPGPAAWIAAGLICFAAVAGLWGTNAKAQNAAPPAAPSAQPAAPAAAPAAAAPAEQAKGPPLTNETCLGCHGVEGLLPTDRAQRGGVPGLMTDRFAGSVHGN